MSYMRNAGILGSCIALVFTNTNHAQFRSRQEWGCCENDGREGVHDLPLNPHHQSSAQLPLATSQPAHRYCREQLRCWLSLLRERFIQQ